MLLTSPKLSRKARAICRIMHADGKNISTIAARVRASRTTVKKAIRNGYVEKDDIEEDHRYIHASIGVGTGNPDSTTSQRGLAPVDIRGHPVRSHELQTFHLLIGGYHRPQAHW